MFLRVKRFKTTKLFYIAVYDSTNNNWYPIDLMRFEKVYEARKYLKSIRHKLMQ